MKQWEIFDFPYPSPAQPHPFVILSINAITENPDYANVNALLCVSVRGDYKLKGNDVWLDQSDGLDGPTVVRCHVMFLLEKSAFIGARRGSVSLARRREIAKKMNLCFGLQGI